MNIYFIASRTQLPSYQNNYDQIILALRSLGHKVDDTYIHAKSDPDATPEELAKEYKDFSRKISDTDLVCP